MQQQTFDFVHEFQGKEPYIVEISQLLDFELGGGWPDRFGAAISTWTRNRTKRLPRVLSLFSGGGGLDIAFHDSGFDVVEMVEIEEQFAATLSENSRPDRIFAGSSVNCIDIRLYDPSFDEGVDFIIGGPPCQTFSAAGRRASGVKGTTDPRGTLFEEYVRILKKLRPKGFLFENVYGITGAEGGAAWKKIVAAFDAAGYSLFWRILDAADYGVPQHRERLFIVGLSNDSHGKTKEFCFPAPTHGPDNRDGYSFYTAGNAIEGADPTDEGCDLIIRGRWGHLITEIPPGLNYSYYTSEMGHPRPVFAWRSKFSDFMYKADPNFPVRTIKAQGGLYTGPFSWENRHFSTSELKRLQTFPDDYAISGSRVNRIHQLGNSVPPQLARILALAIREQIFELPVPVSLPTMDKNFSLGFRQRKRLQTARYRAKAKAGHSSITMDLGVKSDLGLVEFDRFLSPLFKWFDKEDGNSYRVSSRLVDKTLHVNCISIKGLASNPLQFSIAVDQTSNANWQMPFRKVVLRGSMTEMLDFTAAWKALEEILNRNFVIDDLVQWNGYYQYESKIRSAMTFNAEIDEILWCVLRKVVAGEGVGTILSRKNLASVWEIEINEVTNVANVLKEIGYEIRNSNTNPQIAADSYLIPYAFPTLSPASVQLRKSLI